MEEGDSEFAELAVSEETLVVPEETVAAVSEETDVPPQEEAVTVMGHLLDPDPDSPHIIMMLIPLILRPKPNPSWP